MHSDVYRQQAIGFWLKATEFIKNAIIKRAQSQTPRVKLKAERYMKGELKLCIFVVVAILNT